MYPLSCAVEGGCGFRCVGVPQNFRAVARPEHLPTDIPRNATVKGLQRDQEGGVLNELQALFIWSTTG